MKAKRPKGLTLIQTHKATIKELMDYFENLHPKAIRGETYVYVPGSTRMPLLVAHADTVHATEPKMILLDEKKGILSSPTGLGADDRAGVYGILCMHASLDPKPGLLLCDEEESGGIGAYDASWDIADALRPYPFMMELDRKGHGEAVFYNEESQEFIDYICQFGFKEEYGIFSDVMFLGEGLRKSSVNLSIGFEHAHTNGEYLNLAAMNYTIRNAKKIMLNVLHTKASKQVSFKLPKPSKGPTPWYDRDEYSPDTWNDQYNGRFSQRRANDSPPPDVDEYMESGFAKGDEWDRNDARGGRNNKKVCESCRMPTETRWTDHTYGFLCVECYQDWLENMKEAAEYMRSQDRARDNDIPEKTRSKSGDILYQTPDYDKIRSGEQSWIDGQGVRSAIRAIAAVPRRKEMIG